METLLDVLSLRGFFGNKDLEEEVAEYIVGVPESKARRYWDKGYVSSKRIQGESTIEENQMAERKELGLGEKASYEDVQKARRYNKYSFMTEQKIDILNYARLNIKPEYPEERCFHGKNVCVVADSLHLAQVMAYISNSDLYTELPHTKDVEIPEYLTNIQMREEGKMISLWSPAITEPLFQGSPTLATEEDRKKCLTYSKVYDYLQKYLNKELEDEERIKQLEISRAMPRGRTRRARFPIDE